MNNGKTHYVDVGTFWLNMSDVRHQLTYTNGQLAVMVPQDTVLSRLFGSGEGPWRNGYHVFLSQLQIGRDGWVPEPVIGSVWDFYLDKGSSEKTGCYEVKAIDQILGVTVYRLCAHTFGRPEELGVALNDFRTSGRLIGYMERNPLLVATSWSRLPEGAEVELLSLKEKFPIIPTQRIELPVEREFTVLDVHREPGCASSPVLLRAADGVRYTTDQVALMGVAKLVDGPECLSVQEQNVARAKLYMKYAPQRETSTHTLPRLTSLVECVRHKAHIHEERAWEGALPLELPAQLPLRTITGRPT